MPEVVFLIIRQMRRPAFVLLIAYSVAMIGIVLIPTVAPDGEMTHLTIFQAFYWVTYTATTIGYGELPVPFSDWQRVWVALSVYYTVPAWLYGVGKIIALLQDATFQHALAERRFMQRVARLRSKFVIVCGLGEAGSRLVGLLEQAGFHCVVIEKSADRVSKMALNPALQRVMAIVGDAANVELLQKAGVESPFCRAVVAITDSEAVNIKVTLAARLLAADNTRCKTICRTYTRTGSNNAHSFQVDVVINSSTLFTERLTTAIRRPAIADMLARLRTEAGKSYRTPPKPPTGRWIICGYDTLGRTLKRYLDYEGIDSTIVDNDMTQEGVRGMGTEAVTLREARIDRAAAIVAAQPSDPDNLSIAMSAKAMRPSLFVVGKQNRSSNHRLFALAGFDHVMEEADLIVSQIYPLLAQPILHRFLGLVKHQDEVWGRVSNAQFQQLCGTVSPHHCVLRITDKHAPALVKELARGHIVRLQHLWAAPSMSDGQIQAIALLHIRQGKETLMPNGATTLQKDDTILLAYHDSAVLRRIRAAMRDERELYYHLHGREQMRSWLLHYIQKKLE